MELTTLLQQRGRWIVVLVVALVLVVLTYALFWLFDRGGRIDAEP